MTDLSIKNQGLNLAASVYGPHNAPNVLCLHGISNSRDTWLETVDHLRSDYRVWTLDFRGHGHSDYANSYLVENYASDAIAALNVIAKPTIVIGHSLGGIVASLLAQKAQAYVKAVLLEDPPTYLNEPAEWNKTVLSKAFPILRDQQRAMQADSASLQEFINFAANSLAVQGGVIADHQTQRHVDSNGSALQRHDPDTWEPAINGSMLETIDTSIPLAVPCLLMQADPALGPAFLAGHERRFKATNPDAEVITFLGAPHRIHATRNQQTRFLDVVSGFLKQQV